MRRVLSWWLRLPWVLTVLTVLVLTSCTPAQLAIINQHQQQAGNQPLTAEQATDLFCKHGVEGAIAYFGKTKWFRIIEAGDGTVPDCPKPEPVVPIHEQWPWKQLAFCESGGDWHINTGNGYYGGLQFAATSWWGVGGTGYAHQHSPAEQIYRAQRLQAIQGWGAWPACSIKIGLR